MDTLTLIKYWIFDGMYVLTAFGVLGMFGGIAQGSVEMWKLWPCLALFTIIFVSIRQLEVRCVKQR